MQHCWEHNSKKFSKKKILGKNFWEFLGYGVDKDLVCAHKGVVGCREPPRKVTVKDHIIWFRIAFRQITKAFSLKVDQPITAKDKDHLKRPNIKLFGRASTYDFRYHIKVTMSNGKIVYNFNCPVTHCSNSAQAESNLASDINICE